MHSLAFRSGLGDGIYGGWWVGVQAGWWGTTTVTTAGTAAGSPAGQRAIMWLEENTARVQHIMAQKHAWGRLVELGDDLLVNYRRAQLIIQQVVNSTEPEVKVLSGGGRTLTYVGTVQGEQIVVIVYETAEGVRQISNAWVVTR